MFTDRRSYSLSKDQPILQQARRRRARRVSGRNRTGSEFWKNFNVEKLGTLCGHGMLDLLHTRSNTAP